MCRRYLLRRPRPMAPSRRRRGLGKKQMPHVAHVAHHSAGRLRIRVPAAKGNAAALEQIRASLAGLNGVKEVTVNESIGSVTILYDPRQHTNFAQHLASEETPQQAVTVCPEPRLSDLEDLGEMIEHEAQFLSEHSQGAKVIFGWINGLDRGIKRATNNAIDFKVIAPLVLAFGAFVELGVSASTPVWLTLGLFSFNHLVDLHSHPASGAPPPPASPSAAPARPQKKRFP